MFTSCVAIIGARWWLVMKRYDSLSLRGFHTATRSVNASALGRTPKWKIRLALDQMRQRLAELNGMKFYTVRASFLVALSETQAVAGAYDEALVTVEQAVQTNPDELLQRPSVFRLRGELRLRTDAGGKAHFALAEQDFRHAIDLSRTMQAKSVELRATTSLARLLAAQDRRDEARAILGEIYNWFTEGFDTADLGDAKTLLEEL
jgi:tetratricopeptide (TPR) repeat protein